MDTENVTHDSMYKNFLAQALGPATVSFHCYMVSFLGAIAVIVIMINCLTVSKYKDKVNDKVQTIVKSIKQLDKEPVVSFIKTTAFEH